MWTVEWQCRKNGKKWLKPAVTIGNIPAETWAGTIVCWFWLINRTFAKLQSLKTEFIEKVMVKILRRLPSEY